VATSREGIIEYARQVYNAGHHCSEAVALTIGDYYLGETPEIIVRASCPFGGGVGGCRQELCGVVGGGTLILGALLGRISPDEDDDALYEMVCRFRDGFIEQYGTTQCEPVRDTMPDIEKRCLPVVLAGVEILLDLPDEANKKPDKYPIAQAVRRTPKKPGMAMRPRPAFDIRVPSSRAYGSTREMISSP